MKRYIIKLICVAFALALFISCSENELFELSSNAEEPNKSYVNQFKAIWTAIDLNYPIWDYERDEYGLNWDDVYDEYLPKFARMDSLYKETGDTLFPSLFCPIYYDEIFSKLHDGHLSARIKDVYTGKEYESLGIFNEKLFELGIQTNRFNLAYSIIWMSIEDKSIKGHTLLDSKRAYDYTYGHFNGNIVYLHFPNFNLSDIITKTSKTDKDTEILDVWETWFNKVQELHNNGVLRGVILDVRGNLGGLSTDYQYFLGALHNDIDQGGIQTGISRIRLGTGRYDYFLSGKELFSTYNFTHAKITSPIVVLADSTSASMAEHTCLAAKRLPNAKVIGTNTFGAFASSWSSMIKKSQFTDYGHIGDPDLESSTFYIGMPYDAFLAWDNRILEGKGVEPDIFVARDWEYTGDNQLERAFEYLDTGH